MVPSDLWWSLPHVCDPLAWARVSGCESWLVLVAGTLQQWHRHKNMPIVCWYLDTRAHNQPEARFTVTVIAPTGWKCLIGLGGCVLIDSLMWKHARRHFQPNKGFLCDYETSPKVHWQLYLIPSCQSSRQHSAVTSPSVIILSCTSAAFTPTPGREDAENQYVQR